MEWKIMNMGGLEGLCSSFGSFINDQYVISDDCYENLTAVYEQLLEDDPVQRSTRRQLATSHVIEQELVPLITEEEVDPTVFHQAVRLLVTLTLPVECLHLSNNGGPSGVDQIPWHHDIQKMLLDAKSAFATKKCISAIFREIKQIFRDSGEYDLVESDCDAINQCLLLIRNLLHTQGEGQEGLSELHITFLKYLFECGIDEIMLTLLNTKQKDYWGVTVVQLISLLYKDLVSEIFMMFEDASSCGEESCDSSNCSQCEAAMDRPFPMEPVNIEEDKSVTGRASRDGSPLSFGKKDDATITHSCAGEDPTIESAADLNTSEGHIPIMPLCSCFKQACNVERKGSGECCCPSASEKKDVTTASLCNVSAGSVGSTCDNSVKGASNSGRTSQTETNTNMASLDELGTRLTDFTTIFLQNGFSSLVHVLKHVLVRHHGTSPLLDESYFLWSVAFFLKFARRKEIEFKKIQEVFTTDVFGFLVYEAVNSGEEVIHQYNSKQPATLSLRRLHLSVSALRELLKTLSFHQEKGLQASEKQYLELLQMDLANMSDLRQLFLWLIRTYLPNCHSTLFLRDVIVTNHYFLLFLEEWIGKDFCHNRSLSMLSHVKQFATSNVMQQYGQLLQNFVKNDHHVNNCVFTMMHHVAGDCLHPETLLQVNILKTFLQIWDTEMPVTQEMNDLMEYVIQKFLRTAEDNPVSCALQLYLGSQGEEAMFSQESDIQVEGTWTTEDEDKLVKWYSQLDSCPNMIEKIVKNFKDNGIKKSKLEVVNQLHSLGWLSPTELEDFLKDIDLPSLKQGPQMEDPVQDAMVKEEVMLELSRMEEKKFVSHCLKTVREEGLGENLRFLQRILLEAAYIMLDGEFMEKKYIEEPVVKYFIGKGKPVPIVFFNENQEKIGSSVHMIALMQYLGLELDEECPWRYPRIPTNLTVIELIEKARVLGDISPEDVKFDLERTEKIAVTMARGIVDMTIIPDIKDSDKMTVAVPRSLWMRMVHEFNTGQAGKDDLKAGPSGKVANITMELE